MNISVFKITAIASLTVAILAGCASPAPTPLPPTAVPPVPTTVPVATSAPAASAPAVSITLNLGAGRDGDQSGSATLTAQGDKTQVALNIKPGATGVAQPAHIHEGGCPVPAGVKYPLTSIMDGKSTTTLDVKLADLLKGGLAINAHLSGAESAKYVACGVLPTGAVITMDKGRDEDQPGFAVLLDKSGKTEVNLFIKPGAVGVAQPSHIHDGACPVPAGVKYPLTNVMDGKSTSTVDAKLADLLAGAFAINVHKSGQESAKYVACGALSGASKMSADNSEYKY